MLVGMRFILAKYLSANLRDSASLSQYQLVVNCRPAVFFRPKLWTSLRNTSRPATFMVLSMPNSLAALIELIRSPPALAKARTCALELCACSRKDEKSDAFSG